MRLGPRGFLPKAASWFSVAMLALILVSTHATAETRVCATTTVDEPFVTPSGFEHAPGKLTLCRGMEFSPTRTIYVSYVDRAPVGMIVSKRGLSEEPSDARPYMMFARDREGRLHLYGLSMPARGGAEMFLFDAFPFAGPRVTTSARYLGARQ